LVSRSRTRSLRLASVACRVGPGISRNHEILSSEWPGCVAQGLSPLLGSEGVAPQTRPAGAHLAPRPRQVLLRVGVEEHPLDGPTAVRASGPDRLTAQDSEHLRVADLGDLPGRMKKMFSTSVNAMTLSSLSGAGAGGAATCRIVPAASTARCAGDASRRGPHVVPGGWPERDSA
jgi:hypothetical protein